MSGGGWQGKLEVSRCACAGSNPPPSVDPRALSAVVEELGRALAVGELASALGLPDGPPLVAEVESFTASSPTLARSFAVLETGSVFGATARGALAAVRGAAGSALKTLSRHRPLLATIGVVGGGFALGSQYFSTEERVKLAELAERYALVGDTVAAVPEAERAAALERLLGAAASSGGVSVWTLGALGALVVGGVWLVRRWSR